MGLPVGSLSARPSLLERTRPMTPWTQQYNPLGGAVASTLVALLPIAVLLGLLASHRMRAHWAAVVGLAAATTVAVAAIGMPLGLAVRAAAYGAAYGLFPIGWILLAAFLLHKNTCRFTCGSANQHIFQTIFVQIIFSYTRTMIRELTD